MAEPTPVNLTLDERLGRALRALKEKGSIPHEWMPGMLVVFWGAEPGCGTFTVLTWHGPVESWTRWEPIAEAPATRGVVAELLRRALRDSRASPTYLSSIAAWKWFTIRPCRDIESYLSEADLLVNVAEHAAGLVYLGEHRRGVNP